MPHQRARWFAMTCYREVRRISGGGVWSPRPTEGLKCLRRGVGDAAPTQDKMIFTKNVIPRSTATWESVFPVWQRCSVGVLRIATPACGLVRNDIFGKRGGGRRRHTWVPPYGGISRSAVERGNEDAVPYGGMVGDARQAGGVGRRPLRLRGGRDDVGIAPLTGA